MTDRIDFLHDYYPFDDTINVHSAGSNSESLLALGSGSVIPTYTIAKVLYVPGFN